MEVEPPVRASDTGVPAGVASRKRNSAESDTDSDDTVHYYVSSEESGDDTFELVRSRKAKRRFLSTSTNSSASTMRSSRNTEVLTILFAPVLACDMRCLNRQAVSVQLEALVPNEIKEVRVNSRKNILAIDVNHVTALDTLREVTELNGMEVRSHIPLGKEVSTGVIYDVDEAITNTDLPVLIKPASGDTIIASVCRIGTSRCVRIIFKGESLPSHVKVGHFRHAVRPFVPKPLQCWKCMKLGHVSSVCRNATVCSRCTEPHTTDTCDATIQKCSNCNGPHDASSKDCPIIRREIAILKKRVKDDLSHREAAASITRRRSRRRRCTKASKASLQHEPRSKPPPPLPPRPSAVGSKDKDASASNGAEASFLPPRPNAAMSMDNVASTSNTADAWAELPKLHAPDERLQTSTVRDTSSVPHELTDEERQVVGMVNTLVSAIRVLLSKMQTPIARSVLQLLDTITPVLASLQKSVA